MSSTPEPIARGPRSVGVVIVRRIRADWRFLVVRSGDRWDFPKGPLEEGEDACAAAQREAWAGTSLRDLRFDWGDDFRETVSYRGSPVDRYYLAESPSDAVVMPVGAATDQPPAHEYRWVDADEAEELLPPRLAVVLEWARASVER